MLPFTQKSRQSVAVAEVPEAEAEVSSTKRDSQPARIGSASGSITKAYSATPLSAVKSA